MTSPHGFTPYTAAKIASALGGAKREGKGWRAKCPVPGHGKGRGDKRPSLSLRDVENKVLVHCPCGCPQDVVIDALKTQGLWRQEAPYLHKGAAQVAKSAQVTQLTQLTQGKTKQARTLKRNTITITGFCGVRIAELRGPL